MQHSINHSSSLLGRSYADHKPRDSNVSTSSFICCCQARLSLAVVSPPEVSVAGWQWLAIVKLLGGFCDEGTLPHDSSLSKRWSQSFVHR